MTDETPSQLTTLLRAVQAGDERAADELYALVYAELRRLEGHGGQVNSMAIAADGKRLLTGGLDQTLRLWDLQTGKELRTWKDLPGGVWAVAISPDGQRGLFGCGMMLEDGSWKRGTDHRLRLWDLQTGKELLVLQGHTDERGGEAFNLELSKKRAAAVLAYFVDKGIDPARLTSDGYGESRPLDPAHNADAWAKNRRTDFFVEEWVAKPVGAVE